MPRSLINGNSVHSGKRDLWITIESLTETLPDSKYPTEAFAPFFKTWASREFVSLDEQFKSNQLAATAMERWDIPYSVHMDPDRIEVAKKRRINYLGRARNIIAAEVRSREDGRSILLTTQDMAS